jgi:enamine deaminase RidA (YjgF/YER057c/UK114 family)
VIRVPDSLGSLPCSSPVRVGDMLYLSGQTGVPGDDTPRAGGTGPDRRQTRENIKTVLACAGSPLDRVVKCAVFLRVGSSR